MTTNSPPPTNMNEGSPTKKRKENLDGPPQDSNSNEGYPYPQHYTSYPNGGNGEVGPQSQYFSRRQSSSGHYPSSGSYNSSGMPHNYCQPILKGSGQQGSEASKYPPGGSGNWRSGGTGSNTYGSQPHIYNGSQTSSSGYLNLGTEVSRTPSSGNRTPGSMPDNIHSTGTPSLNMSMERDRDMDNKDKGRGSYRCGKCGVPKKGHICPYQPKLKRRADEPPPEMRNAATQVEMDEFLVVRRLNLEIQGFPESYTGEPSVNNVGMEAANPGPMSQHPVVNGVLPLVTQSHQSHHIMGNYSPSTVNGSSNRNRAVASGIVASTSTGEGGTVNRAMSDKRIDPSTNNMI